MKNFGKINMVETKEVKKKLFFFSKPACTIEATSQEEAEKIFRKKYPLNK